jgi:predicted transposase YbfD/YdcC
MNFLMGILATNKKDFINCFMELEDTRQEGKVCYPLDEILFLTISGVLSCAESWREIHDYGVERLDFLRNYFPFTHGIPSKSTICTTLGVIDKLEFEKWFTKWAQNLINILPEDLINIDGKTIKGSKLKNTQATHVLNVFAKRQGIIIGQKSIDKKTNEISEIPNLLDNIEIKGATVTIDALGCQHKITNKIIEKGGDYFISLKENQPKLYNAARYLFADKDKQSDYFDYYSERNTGHGRLEWRKCWSTSTPAWFKKEYPKWINVKSICLIESERHIGSKRSIEKRIYISSEKFDAKKGLECSRGHWSIENQVHHVLDVTFKEDDCQIHNAAENMSVIRKIIINLIRKYKDKTKSNKSIPALRKCSSWTTKINGEILSCLLCD